MREPLPEEVALANREITAEDFVAEMRPRLWRGENPKPVTAYGQCLLVVAALRNLGAAMLPRRFR